MGRLQRWLEPKVNRAREGDTARFINDDPTTVTVRRDGADLPDTLTVRIVPLSMRGQVVGGEVSASLVNPITIVAPAGSDLQADDRILAPGGVVYRIGFVQPDQRWRVEAAAEVLS